MAMSSWELTGRVGGDGRQLLGADPEGHHQPLGVGSALNQLPGIESVVNQLIIPHKMRVTAVDRDKHTEQVHFQQTFI